MTNNPQPEPTGTPYPTEPITGLPYAQPQADTPKKRSKKHLIGYPATALIALMIGSSGGSDTPAPIAAPATTITAVQPAETVTVEVPAPAATQTVTAAPAKPAAPAAARITEGSWEVGVDVPAGKYKVSENIVDTGGMGCSGTVSDSKGNIVDIVYVKGGRPTVTLKKGYTFETADCPDWVKVG